LRCGLRGLWTLLSPPAWLPHTFRSHPASSPRAGSASRGSATMPSSRALALTSPGLPAGRPRARARPPAGSQEVRRSPVPHVCCSLGCIHERKRCPGTTGPLDDHSASCACDPTETVDLGYNDVVERCDSVDLGLMDFDEVRTGCSPKNRQQALGGMPIDMAFSPANPAGLQVRTSRCTRLVHRRLDLKSLIY
jgi:hypothetical protein